MTKNWCVFMAHSLHGEMRFGCFFTSKCARMRLFAKPRSHQLQPLGGWTGKRKRT